MKRYLFSTLSVLITAAAISPVANAAEIKDPTLHQLRMANIDARNKEELKPTLQQQRMANMDERNKAVAFEGSSSTTFPKISSESFMDAL